MGNLNGVVLIDLSAAFDLVDHDILLQKLKIYGLQADIVQLIESYLSERQQAVWIDNTLSEFLPVNVEVPQGSILGSLDHFSFLPSSMTYLFIQ